MDSACVHEVQTAIHELTQGIQMAQQLRLNLHSPEARDFFIKKILSSREKALFALKSGISEGQLLPPALPATKLPEPSKVTGCEEFEFGQPFTIQQGQNVISKKRKGSIAWEDEVRVCSGNRLEDNTYDGFNWRKYGQKDISGAKFPRSYYKCSYRKIQKCLATKQVQRKDEDPTTFEIVYKGEHTCNLGAQSFPPPPPSPSSGKLEITPTHYHRELSSPDPDETLSNLKANPSVDTSDLSGTDIVPLAFSFSSTSYGLMEDYHHQLQLPNHYDDELWQFYSSPFISPDTSESDILAELGTSPTLDFVADPVDVDPDFEEFCNSFF